MSALIAAATVTLGLNKNDSKLMHWARDVGLVTEQQKRDVPTQGFKLVTGPVHGHARADLVRTMALLELLKHVSYEKVTTLFDCYPSHRILRLLNEDLKNIQVAGPPQRLLDYCAVTGFNTYDTPRDASRLPKVDTAADALRNANAALRNADPNDLKHRLYNVLGPAQAGYSRFPSVTPPNSKYRCLQLDAILNTYVPVGHYGFLLMDVYWIDVGVILYYLEKIAQYDADNAANGLVSTGHLYWIGHPIAGQGGLLADDVAWWLEEETLGSFVVVPPQAGLPETYRHPRPDWLTSPNLSVCCLRTVPRCRMGAMYVVELLNARANSEPFRLPNPLIDYMLIPAGWEVWAMQKFGASARSFGAWLDKRAAARGDAPRKVCFPEVVQILHEKYAARSVTSITHTSLQRAASEEINGIDSIQVLRSSNPPRFAQAVEGTAIIAMAGEASQRSALDLWALPAACFTRFVVHRRLKRALGEAVPKESFSWMDLAWEFRYPLLAVAGAALYFVGAKRLSGYSMLGAGSLIRTLGRSLVYTSTVHMAPAAYDIAAVVVGAPVLEEIAKLYYPMRHYIAAFEAIHRGLAMAHAWEEKDAFVAALLEVHDITPRQANLSHSLYMVTMGAIVLSRPMHYLSTGSVVADMLIHSAWNAGCMAVSGQLAFLPDGESAMGYLAWIWCNFPSVAARYLQLHLENWQYVLRRLQHLLTSWQPIVQLLARFVVNAPVVPAERPRIPVVSTDLWDADDNLFAPEWVEEVSSAPVPVRLTAAEVLARMSTVNENAGHDHTVFNPADWEEDGEVADVEVVPQRPPTEVVRVSDAVRADFDSLPVSDPLRDLHLFLENQRDIQPVDDPGDPNNFPSEWAHLGNCPVIGHILTRNVPGPFLDLQTCNFARPWNPGTVVALSHRLPSFGDPVLTHSEAAAFLENQTGNWEERRTCCRAPEGVYPGILYRKKEGLPHFEIPPRRHPTDMQVRARGLPRDLDHYLGYRSKTGACVSSIIDPGVWWCRPATTVANTIGMALARLLAETPGIPRDIQTQLAIDNQVIFDSVYVPNGAPVFPDGIMWAPADAHSTILARQRNLVELYSCEGRVPTGSALECETIVVTTELEDEWLSNFSGHKRIRNANALATVRDNNFDIDDPGVRTVTGMVKSDETLFRTHNIWPLTSSNGVESRRNRAPGLKPRLIVTLKPEVQAMLGPAFLLVARNLSSIWTWDVSLAPRNCLLQDYARRLTGYSVSYHITYAYQPTARKLTTWLSQVLAAYNDKQDEEFFLRVVVAGDDHLVFYSFPCGPLCWLEGDVSMCDQSQSYPTLMRDASRYVQLGLPYPMAVLVLELCRSNIILDLTKARGEYTVEVIPKVGTKLSGGPDTSCGTSICVGEMVMTAMFYEFIDWAVCNPRGQALHRNLAPADLEPGYERHCLDRGMKVKVKAGIYTETCGATFLKGWWVPTSQGSVWTPLPSRIAKVGIADGDVVRKYETATKEVAVEPVIAMANHLANVACGLASTFLTPPLSHFALAWRGCLKARIPVQDWMVAYDFSTNATLDLELFEQQLEKRYDISLKDLDEVGMRYSVPVLPLLVVHPAIEAMVRVDYS